MVMRQMAMAMAKWKRENVEQKMLLKIQTGNNFQTPKASSIQVGASDLIWITASFPGRSEQTEFQGTAIISNKFRAKKRQ